MSYICPVCGFPELDAPPRTQTEGGSYEICPSCRFQFGVTDDDRGISYQEWRAAWIRDGMRWKAVSIPKPDGWNPKEQLERLKIFIPDLEDK